MDPNCLLYSNEPHIQSLCGSFTQICSIVIESHVEWLTLSCTHASPSQVVQAMFDLMDANKESFEVMEAEKKELEMLWKQEKDKLKATQMVSY